MQIERQHGSDDAGPCRDCGQAEHRNVERAKFQRDGEPGKQDRGNQRPDVAELKLQLEHIPQCTLEEDQAGSAECRGDADVAQPHRARHAEGIGQENHPHRRGGVEQANFQRGAVIGPRQQEDREQADADRAKIYEEEQVGSDVGPIFPQCRPHERCEQQ